MPVGAGDDRVTATLTCDPGFADHEGDAGTTFVELQAVEVDVVAHALQAGPRRDRRTVTLQLVGEEARGLAAALQLLAGDATANQLVPSGPAAGA